LKAILNELRLHGDYSTLGEKTNYYLAADNPVQLYKRILLRYQQDYENDRIGLVKDAMSYLWAARRGLTEHELLWILGSQNEPLARGRCSAFLSAIHDSFVDRSGLLNFSNSYLREAVEQIYLPGQEQKRKAHIRLAKHFHIDGNFESYPRQIDEYPWQLARACEWESLAEILAMPRIIKWLRNLNPSDSREYWAQIEKNSKFRMVEYFKTSLEKDKDYSGAGAGEMFDLLFEKGHQEKACSLLRKAIGKGETSNTPEELQNLMRRLAEVHAKLGEIEQAMRLFREQADMCRRIGNQAGLAAALGGQAILMHRKGQEAGALALLKQVERIAISIHSNNHLANCFNNKALVLRGMGDVAGALASLEDATRLAKESGDVIAEITVLGNQALIQDQEGAFDAAILTSEKQEALCRRFDIRNMLANCLQNQAGYLRNAKRGLDALHKNEEAVALYSYSSDCSTLATVLLNQAAFQSYCGLFKDSKQTLQRAREIVLKLGSSALLQRLHKMENK